MEKESTSNGNITQNADTQISPSLEAVHAHLEMEETYVKERQEAFEVKRQHQPPGERIKALVIIVFDKLKAQLPGPKSQD